MWKANCNRYVKSKANRVYSSYINVWLRSSKVEEQGRQTSCVDKLESLQDKDYYVAVQLV